MIDLKMIIKKEETTKKKHSLTRKLVGIGIGGNGGVKRKGTRF